MAFKTVRFADTDEAYSHPNTPSPSMSQSTLSTNGPQTPSSGSSFSYIPLPQDKLIDGSVEIHDVLGVKPEGSRFKFDISCDPSQSDSMLSSSVLTPRVRCEAATIPPLASITLVCGHLPWKIHIYPSSCKPGAFVTVGDLLSGLYYALRQGVKPEEFYKENSHMRKKITQAFLRRCSSDPSPAVADKEYKKGVKRVDFLVDHLKFYGLSRTEKGPHVWRLSVTE